jgi:hypothetical protein
LIPFLKSNDLIIVVSEFKNNSLRFHIAYGRVYTDATNPGPTCTQRYEILYQIRYEMRYESVCSRYWYSRKGEKATKHSIALVASFLPPFPCLLCASACRPFSFRSSSPSSQPRIPLLSTFKLQPHLTYPSYILTPL